MSSTHLLSTTAKPSHLYYKTITSLKGLPKVQLISLQFELQKLKDLILEDTQSSILKMAISMISRTGRQLQRYNEGCRQVVGCVPYKYNGEGELEVLLISSQKGEHKMFFPKGGWEIDELIEEAAERETFEEAGVRGDIKDKLGKWMFKSKRYGTYYEGSMFSLFVREQPEFWPEKDVRTRRWMTVEEAREICQPMWMIEALDELVCRLTKDVIQCPLC